MKSKRKIKKSFWKPDFRESWSYIKESRNFIYAVLFIFLAFLLLGAFIPVPDVLAQKLMEFIEEILQKTENMSFLELLGFLFLNNSESSFLGMIFGIFFGIFSVFTAMSNGYLIGFVSSRVISSEGILVLWRLFPHGIFELPAVMISLGLGLRLGTFIIQKNKLEFLKNNLWKSLRVFLFVILPLLFIAAIIEAALISFSGIS